MALSMGSLQEGQSLLVRADEDGLLFFFGEFGAGACLHVDINNTII